MQSATLCSPHRLSVDVRKLQTGPAMRKRYRSCSSVCVDVDKVASTCSPHLCVGFLFLILYLAASSAASALPLCHTSLTHTIHTTLSHTTLSPTIFHTQLCHTHHLSHTTLSHNFVTHNFVTHHLSHTTLSHTTLSHTTLSHTIFHTQLCHTPSFTHNFVTHNFVTHHLSHTTLSHTTLSHTIFHTSLCHTQLCHPTSLTHNFVTHHLSRTTLSHTHTTLWQTTLSHTQLCHPPSFTHNFVTHNFGRRGTWRHLPSFLVAGVALGDIYLRLAWQAWHLETSTCVWRGRRGTCCTWWRAWSPLVAVGRPGRRATLRGRRGTWRRLPAFGVAGVALGDIYLRLAWQAWRLLRLVARLVAVGRLGRRASLRGRRGTWWHSPSFCVAGVALGDIYLRLAWQAWHLFVSRGRRGTWRHLPAFGVAGVALGDIYLRLAWQAWHLETSTCVWRGRRGTCCTWWRAWSPLVAVGRPGRRATLRGRCGTWRHLPAFGVSGVAGVALGDIMRHLPLFHVAGVALWDLYLHLAGQGWDLETSTCVWCGRRGTCCTWWRAWSPLVAVGRRWSPGAPRHFAWQAWHLETPTFVSRGWRGTWRHLPAFGVAGVALGDIYLRLAWQAWHLLHLVARLVAVGRRWSPLVAWGAAPLSVAGVALGDIHLRFAWQACRLETSTCVWHGRRGTCSFHVAGVALGDIHLRFAWQAWHLETSTFVSRGRWALGCLCLDPPSLTHHLSNTTFVTHHLWHTTLSHTIFDTPSFTHHLCHTPSFTHTIFYTQLCHTPSLTLHLLHTTLSPTIFDTPSFTHHFVTHPHPHTIFHTTLSHTIFHTPSLTHHLSHTTLSHTIFHHTIFHTPSFTHNFVTHHLWHTLFHTPSLSNSIQNAMWQQNAWMCIDLSLEWDCGSRPNFSELFEAQPWRPWRPRFTRIQWQLRWKLPTWRSLCCHGGASSAGSMDTPKWRSLKGTNLTKQLGKAPWPDQASSLSIPWQSGLSSALVDHCRPIWASQLLIPGRACTRSYKLTVLIATFSGGTKVEFQSSVIAWLV